MERQYSDLDLENFYLTYMHGLKYSFVILHYCAIKETIDLVDSIFQKIDAIDYKIIIVDNASSNCTGEELEKIYANNNKVHIILSKKNLGFANGMNLGFSYAKNIFKSNFIIILNNDTLIIQSDFCKVIKEEYEKSSFYVLGPQIIDKFDNDTKQNPGRNCLHNRIELIALEMSFRLELFCCKHKLYKIYEKISKMLKKNISIKKANLIRKENIWLHGCCLVFSENFIKKYDGLDTRTFLFMEENILFAKLFLNKHLTVFNPDLKIKHLEDAATDMIYSNRLGKKIFVLENILKSFSVYKKVLNEQI